MDVWWAGRVGGACIICLSYIVCEDHGVHQAIVAVRVLRDTFQAECPDAPITEAETLVLNAKITEFQGVFAYAVQKAGINKKSLRDAAVAYNKKVKNQDILAGLAQPSVKERVHKALAYQ